MLEIQKDYTNYLLDVEKEIDKTNLALELKEKFGFADAKESIANIELIIPVVGAFSAGKSTLLNSFLGAKHLPEKITPETALATELRFSLEEYILAVKSDDSHEKFDITQMELIKSRASEFKYLQLFLNNENLKKIEPLVLVDMPGFESPLDLHNQAIMEYIDKGVHYIVLTSVEDGNITRSMVRQLESIREYGRDFSFFLSKTNLKPQDEIEEISQKVKDQIEEYFDMDKEVYHLDNNGGENLKRILSNIDPEKLIENIFLDSLRDNYYSIKELLNTQVSALGKSKEQNAEEIMQLQKALQETQRKRDELIEESKEKYSDVNVNRIADAVGKDLSNSMDELVTTTMSGGGSAVSGLISEIVRGSLISNVKVTMSDISNNIVDKFSMELSQMSNLQSGISLSENWVENITETTKNFLNNGKNKLNTMVQDRQSNENTDKSYKALTTVLAVTTEVVNPLLELAIVFLPELINMFMKSYQENKLKQQIQSNILTSVIPSLKRELRSNLPSVLNTQIEELIVNISNEFESKINEKQMAIEAAQKEIDEKNIDLDKEIALYSTAIENITKLANNTLYRG